MSSNLKNIISGLIQVDTKQNAHIKNLSGVISGLNFDEVGGTGKFVQSILQDKGKISAVAADLTAQNVKRTATVALTGTNVQTVLNDLDSKINAVAASTIIINGLSAINVEGSAAEKTITLKISDTDKFLSQSDAGLYATVGISSVVPEGAGTIAKKYFLTGKDGQKIEGTQIDILKDQYLSGMHYNPDTKQLIIVYYTSGGTTASSTIDLSGLVDTYTGASGIELVEGNKFIGKVDVDSQSYLTVGQNGFKLSGVYDLVSSSIKPISGVLAGYTETSSVINAVNAKVDKVEGKDLSTNDYTNAQKDKLEKLDLDYTAWQVYANNTNIPTGYCEQLSGTVTEEISVNMTQKFNLRLNGRPENSDIVVDWGDNTKSIIANAQYESISTFSTTDQTCTAVMAHTYTNPGKYIIKVFGTKYFALNHGIAGYSLLCRCFTQDLPIASHLHNLASFAQNSNRLLKVIISDYRYIQNITNISYCFSVCRNLLSVTGLEDKFSMIQKINGLFYHSLNLKSTDFILPAYANIDQVSFSSIFTNCYAFQQNISTIIPKKFVHCGNINVKGLFNNCYKLNGTVTASALWENTNITWITDSTTFSGCSDAIRAQVPISWGGTNTQIQAKLDAGYWTHVIKNDITSFDTSLSGLVADIEALKQQI